MSLQLEMHKAINSSLTEEENYDFVVHLDFFITVLCSIANILIWQARKSRVRPFLFFRQKYFYGSFPSRVHWDVMYHSFSLELKKNLCNSHIVNPSFWTLNEILNVWKKKYKGNWSINVE